MNDIRIYDFEFNLLHIEPDVLSSYWILHYNDIGTFEGTFPLTSDICDVIMKNKYLILIQGDLQAVITAYMADKKLTVYGKTLNWMLSKRTCPTFNTENLFSPGEIIPGDVMVKLGQSIFSDVSNFEFVNLTDTVTSEKYLKDKRVAFSEVLKEYLDLHNLGHRVKVDVLNKKWVFEVYQGKVLPGVLSEGNRNLTDIVITDDAQEYFSSAWYNRKLEDMGDIYFSQDITPTLSEEPVNYGRYYTIAESVQLKYPKGSYLVCTDISGKWRVCSELPVLEEKVQGEQAGIYDWDTFVSGVSLSEAQAELASKKWSHTLKALAVKLKYNNDYSLGDTIRVQARKGSYEEHIEKMISGVDIWWESGNVGEKVKFKSEE